MRKNMIKKIIIASLVLFLVIEVDMVSANLCPETFGVTQYMSSSLALPTHLQVYQQGNTIRVKGRIAFDASGLDVSDLHKYYGCGFLVEICKDCYAKDFFGENGTACNNMQRTSESLVMASGTNVEGLTVQNAACDVDTTFSIPATYFTQNNNIADYLTIYPWWGEVTRVSTSSPWSYPICNFAVSQDACGASNFGIFSEHIKLTSPAVNGVCGTAARIFTATETGWGGYTACALGTGILPVFPAQGATANWTCSGVNGGASAPCSASRSVAAVCVAGCDAFSACSAPCGGGTYSRTCTLADCTTNIETQACNTQACSIQSNWKEIAP